MKSTVEIIWQRKNKTMNKIYSCFRFTVIKLHSLTLAILWSMEISSRFWKARRRFGATTFWMKPLAHASLRLFLPLPLLWERTFWAIVKHSNASLIARWTSDNNSSQAKDIKTPKALPSTMVWSTGAFWELPDSNLILQSQGITAEPSACMEEWK